MFFSCFFALAQIFPSNLNLLVKGWLLISPYVMRNVTSQCKGSVSHKKQTGQTVKLPRYSQGDFGGVKIEVVPPSKGSLERII